MKKTETTRTLYYEIKSADDYYGMCGRFKDEYNALDEINASYLRAKELGYDNRHEKWIIVCVNTTITRRTTGEFFKEETVRTMVAGAEFDEYTNRYVLVIY